MISPPLKWAGGKRWLVGQEARLPIPAGFSRYVEPFAGSAAVFFHLRPKSAVLSDLNPELINFYRVLRDSPADLLDAMERHQDAHNKSYYYAVRALIPNTKLERAARFLYLNRTCWNGLYRVNKRGEFNVPIGTKTAVIMEGDDFQQCSTLLKGASLKCGDFEPVIDGCGDGDFVFVDPPYTVKHNANGFLKYNEQIFGWEDQVRLHAALRRASNRGASICVTNANHLSVRGLYEGFRFSELRRKSVLAGDASARGATTEALFTVNI